MLAQRVFGIALGYAELTDHDELRRGPALQVAAEREPDPEKQLASAPTLCRLAGRMGREALWGMAEVPVESFIATRPAPLQRLLLDFDATDDPVFGQQESYCARGEMGNRIKEHQLRLFADRTSCQRFLANEFRLLLAVAAYVLVQQLRCMLLTGTELARAQVRTIREKLLKIGARTRCSVRRIVFHFAGGYPFKGFLRYIVGKLPSGSDPPVSPVST